MAEFRAGKWSSRAHIPVMTRTIGPKERQIMDYLHEHIFDPILVSGTASTALKQGVRLTIIRMMERDALGMDYFWAALKGTERSIGFAARMRNEGFDRFEEALEDFRVRFGDRFLRP
ncbi:hypothetical protein [Bradyrhizobium sp.]|uniref:hypothetical protein n=1 Tax=Bradyrhizobium sp. TaxID=376 RepID=UPI002DF805A4|nr:hypothetical protein [Bradyrhizobium sp.]